MEEAIETVGDARGYPIERPNYLAHLRNLHKPSYMFPKIPAEKDLVEKRNEGTVPSGTAPSGTTPSADSDFIPFSSSNGTEAHSSSGKIVKIKRVDGVAMHQPEVDGIKVLSTTETTNELYATAVVSEMINTDETSEYVPKTDEVSEVIKPHETSVVMESDEASENINTLDENDKSSNVLIVKDHIQSSIKEKSKSDVSETATPKQPKTRRSKRQRQ